MIIILIKPTFSYACYFDKTTFDILLATLSLACHHSLPPLPFFFYFKKYICFKGKHWVERNGEMRHVTELNEVDSLYFGQ